MHFWIDKRSQACGFGGRHRVPSSLSAGGSRPQIFSGNPGIWGGGSYLRTSVQAKPMVTPVHRFQSIESVASATAIAGNSRLPRHYQYSRNQVHSNGYRSQQQPHQQSIINVNLSEHGDQQNNINNSQHQQQQPQQRNVSAPTSNHASELDNRLYLDVPNVISDTVNGPQLAGPMKVKCSGFWLSFGLLTLFAGGVRFYLSNQQDSGIEVLVFAMILIMALLATCYLGVCRTNSAWEVFEAMVSQQQQLAQTAAARTTNVTSNTSNSIQRNQPTADSISNQVTQEEIMLNTVLGLQPPNTNSSNIPQPPPPPYHIAVLLPQQPILTNQPIDESPPPSYDKVVS